MKNYKALGSAAILGMVASLFAGCGDGDNTKTDVCKPKVAECLTSSEDQPTNAGRVCNADGTELVTFTCGAGETCVGEGKCTGDCEAGDKQCASDDIARVCSEDGKQWLPVACSPGTICAEGECVPADEGVQVCTPGKNACADDLTLKTCDSDGSQWINHPCAEAEHCVEDGDDASCVFDDGKTCVPGVGTCIDSKTSGTCNADGNGYTIQDCPDTAPCTDGACHGPVCVPGQTQCAPAGTAGDAQEYNPFVLYTCNAAGTGWNLEQCGLGTICVYDNINGFEAQEYGQELKNWYYGGGVFPTVDTSHSTASCVTPDCEFPEGLARFVLGTGLFGFNDGNYYGNALDSVVTGACGDATDGYSDPVNTYSTCVGLAPFTNLTWSVQTCAAPQTCNPDLNQIYNPSEGNYFSIHSAYCAADCVPGQTRCMGETLNYYGNFASEGMQTCLDDGTWGTFEECPIIDSETYEGACVTQTSSTGSVAKCVDPVCAYWITNNYGTVDPYFPDGYTSASFGACTQNGEFRSCDADGFLTDAAACDTGSCYENHYYGTFEFSGSVDPGLCGAECQDGQVQCFSAGAIYGIQTCVEGQWSLEIDQCGYGETCQFYYGAGDAMGSAVCGECSPGQTTCDGDDPTMLVTCGDDGFWSDPEACDYGLCNPDSETTTKCEAECLPGDVRCAGSYYGYNQFGGQQTCSDDGVWEDIEFCDVSADPYGEYCRRDNAGNDLGCVACIGSGAGNQYGTADSYCDVDDALVTCGADNTWNDPVDCGTDVCYPYFEPFLSACIEPAPAP